MNEKKKMCLNWYEMLTSSNCLGFFILFDVTCSVTSVITRMSHKMYTNSSIWIHSVNLWMNYQQQSEISLFIFIYLLLLISFKWNWLGAADTHPGQIEIYFLYAHLFKPPYADLTDAIRFTNRTKKNKINLIIHITAWKWDTDIPICCQSSLKIRINFNMWIYLNTFVEFWM